MVFSETGRNYSLTFAWESAPRKRQVKPENLSKVKASEGKTQKQPPSHIA